MIDSLLTSSDQKEDLSFVYAKALVIRARAGYLASVPEPDRDSTNLRIQAGGAHCPAFDLQLKATVCICESRGGSLSFRLSIKNYNDLRIETQTPQLLVVLELPNDESLWMTVTIEKLILRCGAYWLNLQWGVGPRGSCRPENRYRSYTRVERIRCRDPVRANGAVQGGRTLMQVSIHDRNALLAISPAVLSAYARVEGWH